jgi:hypothetical protein
MAYWDGPNYVYAGATLYNIPQRNPWTNGFGYPPSYFACHLPGYPLVIRVCALLCFGNYVIGFHLSILLSGIFFSLTFRRLLVLIGGIADPVFSTILAALVPMRVVIYHSVGASEPLFLTFVCLAFSFYRTDQFWLMLGAVWGGCITRIEGMAIGAAIGFSYLIQLKIWRAFGMVLTFLAPLAVVGLHAWRFKDPWAYIHFNKDSQKLIQWPPFGELARMRGTKDDFEARSFISAYGPFALGAVLLCARSLPIGFFSIIFVIYVSVLFHIDIYRYALPGAVFGLIVGLEGFWASRTGKVAFWVGIPLYATALVLYVQGQIHSNVAPSYFMDEVMAHIYGFRH